MYHLGEGGHRHTIESATSIMMLLGLLAQACTPAHQPPLNALTPYPQGTLDALYATGTAQAINDADINATPYPNSLLRMSVSSCVARKNPENACVDPLPISKLLNLINQEQMLIIAHRADISDYSYRGLTKTFSTIVQDIQANQDGEANSVPVSSFISKFPYAAGGTTVTQVDRNNTNPKGMLYLPQFNSDSSSSTVSTPQSANMLAHEGTHLSEAINRFSSGKGILAKSSSDKTGDFTGSDYHGQTVNQEEYTANYLGDVLEIVLASTSGDIDSLQYKNFIQNDIDFKGHYTPFISAWCDHHDILPENPLYQLLFDTDSWYPYKQMAEKYGDQNYIDREKEIVHNWNNFPWTPEYIDLMNRMIAEQTKAGQMIPGAYPQVPSYIKTGSEITPYLIITATPKP